MESDVIPEVRNRYDWEMLLANIKDISGCHFWLNLWGNAPEVEIQTFIDELNYYRKPVIYLPENPTQSEIENATDEQLDEFCARNLENMAAFEELGRRHGANKEFSSQKKTFDELHVIRICFGTLCSLFF